MTRGLWATGIRRELQRILITSAVLCIGCGGTLPSPFVELERTRPVSPAKIHLVTAFVDGVHQQHPPAELVVHAKQSFVVYGTVEDGKWKFGGTSGFKSEGAFAWRKEPTAAVVSELTKDPPVAIFTHIHRMKNHTTLAPPEVEMANQIVAANRRGADFDVKLAAPAKPGEYVLDLLGVGGDTINESAAGRLPNQAIFWRAKLRVTAPK